MLEFRGKGPAIGLWDHRMMGIEAASS